MTTVDVADALDLAAERVARGWAQGTSARNALGESVRAEDETAVCWCALGAIAAAVFTLTGARHHYDNTQSVVFALRGALKLDFVGEWNDAQERTAKDVIAVFRATAAAYRKRRPT